MKKITMFAMAFVFSLAVGFSVTFIAADSVKAGIGPGPIDFCEDLGYSAIVYTFDTYQCADPTPYVILECQGQMHFSGALCDCVYYGCWGPDENIE